MDKGSQKQEPKQKPNRLSGEKSPYLLQHADNPVEWFPWGDEAFSKAKREDKPIFLSIGYSTCHWCHVMAHEYFQDAEVARILNDAFVSIKVDREERPDVDNVYMSVCQMITGSGGWPLTIVMTPDRKPFYAGTYFPKKSKMGRIGLLDLLPRLSDIWRERREQTLEAADQVVEALRPEEDAPALEKLDSSILDKAYIALLGGYDEKNGGFGRSPKFPMPHDVTFLLRYWKRTGSEKALEMAMNTLTKMRMGGIFDQCGFGFHRYSTDERWLVPHFEKMLYDQALLSIAYLEGYLAAGKEEMADVAREIFTYVLRDLRDPGGGFYCGEDADSEGVEGKFYLWKWREIIDLLGNEDGLLAAETFNAWDEGNFMDEASAQPTGMNILHLKAFPPIEREKMESIRERLFSAREKRIRPHRDDKILTDWNGLMIGALAMGGAILGKPEYLMAAESAARFILDNLREPAGGLLHRYRDGQGAIAANVDDYAFLVFGLIELYGATFKQAYLNVALSLNRYFLDNFRDKEGRGFFFTPGSSEDLPVRLKVFHDGAIPSGNSMAMLNLIRLGKITGDASLEEIALGISEAASGEMWAAPTGFLQMLSALDFALGPSVEAVIAGKPGEKNTEALISATRSGFAPNKVVLLRPLGGNEDEGEILGIAPYLKDMRGLGGEATVYICDNFTCEKPTTDPVQMKEMMGIVDWPAIRTGEY